MIKGSGKKTANAFTLSSELNETLSSLRNSHALTISRFVESAIWEKLERTFRIKPKPSTVVAPIKAVIPADDNIEF